MGLFPRVCIGCLLLLCGPLAIHATDVRSHLDICVIDPVETDLARFDSRLSGYVCSEAHDLAAAQGEFEPFGLALRSETPVHALSVEPSDLLSSSGRIPASSVDVRYVKSWFQAEGSPASVRRTGKNAVLVPELLLRDDNLIYVDRTKKKNFLHLQSGSFVDITKSEEAHPDPLIVTADEYPIEDSETALPISLEPNITRIVWVTVHVPDDARAGRYTGTVRLVDSSKRVIREVPVQLRVWSFHLSPPVLMYSIYYRGQLDSSGVGSISSEIKSIAQFRNELRDMRDHGISNPTIYQAIGGDEGFLNVLSIRRQEGFSNRQLFLLGLNAGNYLSETRFKRDLETLDEWRRIAGQHGARDIYVYAVDEATPSELLAQRDGWRRLKSHGAKIFAATYKYGAEYQILAEQIDAIVLGIRQDPKVVQHLRNSGADVFLYNQPQVGLEAPGAYRRAYGISAWKNGYTGVMPYAYQHSMGFIWNDLDHPSFRDHVFAYPTSTGVIGTVQWEGFREAVDDVRYVSTLLDVLRRVDYPIGNRLIERAARSDVSPVELRRQIATAIEGICSAAAHQSELTGICLPR